MDTSTPLAHLVAELVAIGGQLTSTLDHMHHWRDAGLSSPDADPIPVVLARVLESALEPLIDRRPADDLLTAAGVLRDAADAIEDNLFMVVPD